VEAILKWLKKVFEEEGMIMLRINPVGPRVGPNVYRVRDAKGRLMPPSVLGAYTRDGKFGVFSGGLPPDHPANWKRMAYFYGGGFLDGKDIPKSIRKDVLGGKGIGLMEMTEAGLPVPPGFTLPTFLCAETDGGKRWPEGLKAVVLENMKRLEEVTGKGFGNPNNPLLVSVRSGAKFSMPGMMDTILNIGLNDQTVEGLAKNSGNRRFALDAYRRLIQMFGKTVKGIEAKKFEEILEAIKREKGYKADTELTEDDLQNVIARFKQVYQDTLNEPFPQDPQTQLEEAISAVFKSWYGERATVYRTKERIPHELGTAVNVVTMVFGNMGENSGTGVAFTRNTATGEKEYYGEYLFNAQGEDVVAGIRTPLSLAELKERDPEIYEQLVKGFELLERYYRDVQDVEFTVENGKLFFLQTRSAKRTGLAAVKIAVDMVREGLITEEQAILLVKPEHIDQLLHPMFDPQELKEASSLVVGLPASPGAAVGKVVFDAHELKRLKEENPKEKYILVRPETSPDDVIGMEKAEGILTAKGGFTSHAAVVARGWGKPCVAGCGAIIIDEAEKKFFVGSQAIREGEVISIDGSTGKVYKGALKLVPPSLSGDFGTFMSWVKEYQAFGVRANADYPKDAKVARDFGAVGIGLTRTEHMFFAPDRLPIVQEMILATTETERRAALNKLLPIQREDFYGILKVMDGYPVTIRTLDPPLHEFLPKREEIEKIEDPLLKTKLLKRLEELHELNPMLGFRGTRLGIVYPEITEMQVRAILEAAVRLKKEGFNPVPEIEIPLTMDAKEFALMVELVHRTAKNVFAEQKVAEDFVHYEVGTMLELPAAALITDKLIAAGAEFFSFGTNDLTQTTLGLSRDDAGKFLPIYVEKGIFSVDPFVTVDQLRVGELIRIAVKKAREKDPNCKISVCGEHGGDPESVAFFAEVGLTDVSCSPFRVPIARLAAAQAAIKFKLSSG